ncbi:MAG: sensor histidine kinase, partial [Gemmatimonadaceae bacterium]
ILSSSLDYETTVSTVARLAVPDFADWCAVDLLVGGDIKRLAVAHDDPDKVRRLKDVGVKLQPSPEVDAGVPAVIRTGEPHFAPIVTDDMLVRVARDDQHLALLRSVGIHSAMIVPVATRGIILGALTLVSSRPERRFDEADLATAQALGRRAAVAIDNARLYQSARAADEIKRNFLATMSHELRTPLTAIIGFEQLLADGISAPVSEGQRRPLERIKVSALQLLSLIDEMFLFARLDSGDETVRADRVSAKHLVDEVMAAMSRSAVANGLVLRADATNPDLTIQTDFAKLRQILVSLVSNAVKFTTRGEIVIRVLERNGGIVFEVADTGIGIRHENLEHIFDPFWQVEQTKTRKTGGSGLGLSVARRLAELLGGKISVESTPSVGSTFRVALPRSMPPPNVARRVDHAHA